MSKRIKILFTIPNFDTAGSGKVVYDLIKGLDKSLFDPHICCFHTKGAFFEEIKKLDVRIHVFDFAIKYKPFLSLPFRILKIRSFFKTHSFDLIHSWHWSSDFTEPLAAKLAGIPFVYTKKAMGWGNKSWKWRSQLSTKIITINKDMVSEFFSNMLNKIEEIPLGVDTNYFTPLAKSYEVSNNISIDTNDFVIVSIANLAPVKGIEILLEAVKILNDDRIKVFIVGDNDNDYGKKLISTFNKNDTIRFLGKQLDIRPYLAIADVFIIPTKNEGRKEGMPIAPLEAMASARIVLGSNISGIRDILNSRKDLLFTPDNVDSLISAIKVIRNLSEQERKNLESELRTIVERDFTVSSFLSKHESLYKTLIK